MGTVRVGSGIGVSLKCVNRKENRIERNFSGILAEAVEFSLCAWIHKGIFFVLYLLQ